MPDHEDDGTILSHLLARRDDDVAAQYTRSEHSIRFTGSFAEPNRRSGHASASSFRGFILRLHSGQDVGPFADAKGSRRRVGSIGNGTLARRTSGLGALSVLP